MLLRPAVPNDFFCDIKLKLWAVEGVEVEQIVSEWVETILKVTIFQFVFGISA